MNPEAQARYQRQPPAGGAGGVLLAPCPKAKGGEGDYNPRLDLVLFVNGIPTATLELKSEFKQSVENAKRQYRKDRPPKDPVTRKPEPLLTFKRGALVHFAVSQYEVAMTTRLAGQGHLLPALQPGHARWRRGQPDAGLRGRQLRHRLPVGAGVRAGRLAQDPRPLPAPAARRRRTSRAGATKGDADLPALPPVGRGEPLVDATRAEGPGHAT
jgi:hypothetical protein